jgi:guanosine-3',5'-bis(diphosphate) 3'-pyrophosphohydrolase
MNESAIANFCRPFFALEAIWSNLYYLPISPVQAVDPFPVFELWTTWAEARAGLEQRVSPAALGRVQQAYDFAVIHHSGQLTPTGLPYIRHLLTVLEVLVRGLDVTDPDLLAGALLHDVVEDTDCSLTAVEEQFGPRVGRLVAWLTARPPQSGEAPPTARSRYLSRFSQAPEEVLLIKLADRLTNVQRLDTHPRVEKQRSYYRETVDHVLPLTPRIPWFECWFASWQARFGYLARSAEP